MVRCSPDPDEGAADSVELAGSAPRDEATTADVDAAPCSTLPLDCDTCAQASAVSGSKTSAVKSGRTNATSFTGCRPFRQVASRSYDAPPEAVSREAPDVLNRRRAAFSASVTLEIHRATTPPPAFPAAFGIPISPRGLNTLARPIVCRAVPARPAPRAPHRVKHHGNHEPPPPGALCSHRFRGPRRVQPCPRRRRLRRQGCPWQGDHRREGQVAHQQGLPVV